MQAILLRFDTPTTQRLSQTLTAMELEPVAVDSVREAVERLHAPDSDVRLILADYGGADGQGLDLINALLAADVSSYPYILFFLPDNIYQRVLDSLGPIPGDFLVAGYSDDDLKARLSVAERTIALQERLHNTTLTSESLAIYDHLTGVLNRQAVYERALAEHNRAQRERLGLCLVMVDIHHLDEIREAHGPQVRDQALRFVARAARANVRLYDLVGRWIGSKFLVMLPGATPDNAGSIVERIHNSITAVRIRLPEGERVELDVRIGYTSIDAERTLPLYMLIEQANDALGRAMSMDDAPVQLFREG